MTTATTRQMASLAEIVSGDPRRAEGARLRETTVRDLYDMQVANGTWSCQTLELPALPAMNEALAAKGATYRFAGARKRSAYTTLADRIIGSVIVECRLQHLRPVTSAWFGFTWHEKTRRRDPDNIAMARKWILDGIVRAGVLPSDGWRHVHAPIGFPTFADWFAPVAVAVGIGSVTVSIYSPGAHEGGVS